MKQRRALLRADAGAGYGVGHAMRCRSLAQGLAAHGFACHFAAAELLPAVAGLLAADGFVLHDLGAERGSRADGEALAALGRRLAADLLVIDGYCFDSDWRRRARRAGRIVLAFDDLGDVAPLHADLVLTAAPIADAIDYARIAPGAGLLLGGDYALVRAEIAAERPQLGPIERRRELFLMIGGTDPLRLTAPLARALAEQPFGFERLVVAIGGGHPDREGLAALAAAGALTLLVDRFDIGPSLAQAGLAITGGGTTLGELATLGVPAVIAIVADNQFSSVEMLVRDGAFQAVDARAAAPAPRLRAVAAALWADLERRKEMSARLLSGCDGQGARRVAAAVLHRLGDPPATNS